MIELKEYPSDATLFSSRMDANKAKRSWNNDPPIPGTIAMVNKVETFYGTRFRVQVRGPYTRQRPSWDHWDYHGYI